VSSATAVSPRPEATLQEVTSTRAETASGEGASVGSLIADIVLILPFGLAMREKIAYTSWSTELPKRLGDQKRLAA
jgi:hypothetical protein